ncbi:hypothetical protein, partial [Komagataeibacter rhaeticus]|uniref:hypothetical protein n=1 Tax=Komagataeibacter rhaeticus TaxID=215221 RepID=UPI00241F5B37
AKPAQPSKALFNIKETRLLHLPPSPINAEEMESHRTAQSQGFFEPSTCHFPTSQRITWKQTDNSGSLYDPGW